MKRWRCATTLVLLVISGGVEASAQSFPAIPIKPPGTATAVRVYYVTDRSVPKSTSISEMYSVDRSLNGVLSYGTCTVTIPRSHVIGLLEEPGPFESEDITKHVILQRVEPNPESEFYRLIRAQIAKAERHDTFVFIHGFATTFQNAARRTAQIAYDLKFDGAPIFYSWPSQGKESRYTVDETNAEWTVPHLVAFLKDLRTSSEARRVHIIAHSMGGRILAKALQELQALGQTPRFNEIVFAAADIDRDTFVGISAAINRTADRITLYASSRDRALKLSKALNGYPRLGDFADGIVVLPGFDSVDASSVSTDFFAHSYFSGRTVLSDLFFLLRYDLPPPARFAVFQRASGGQVYWEFHP